MPTAFLKPGDRMTIPGGSRCTACPRRTTIRSLFRQTVSIKGNAFIPFVQRKCRAARGRCLPPHRWPGSTGYSTLIIPQADPLRRRDALQHHTGHIARRLMLQNERSKLGEDAVTPPQRAAGRLPGRCRTARRRWRRRHWPPRINWVTFPFFWRCGIRRL